MHWAASRGRLAILQNLVEAQVIILSSPSFSFFRSTLPLINVKTDSTIINKPWFIIGRPEYR